MNKLSSIRSMKKQVLPIIESKILHYSFEGGTATDNFNSYNGIDNSNNSIVSTNAKYGSFSCRSDGLGGSKQFVTAPSFPFDNSKGLTFSMWIYTIAQPAIIDTKIFEFTREGIMLWNGKQSNNYDFANGTVFTMPLASWNHLVVSITSSSDINVYVNNVLTVTETITGKYPLGNIFPSGNIGRSLSTRHSSHNGYIDDFKIYNKILSLNEVGYLYNGISL